MIIYRRYHTASHAAVLLGIMTFCVADASPGLSAPNQRLSVVVASRLSVHGPTKRGQQSREGTAQ